jgi:hypothetical protein
VAIDLTTETLIPLAVAAKLVPPGRNGKRTHISTLLRWILRGAKSPSGQLVRLEAARLGSRWVTSRAALQRFAEKLTPVLNDATAPRQIRGPGQRQRASERAARELAKEGI